jgi:hypothetical protein
MLVVAIVSERIVLLSDPIEILPGVEEWPLLLRVRSSPSQLKGSDGIAFPERIVVFAASGMLFKSRALQGRSTKDLDEV